MAGTARAWTVGVTGASGLVGSALVTGLTSAGHRVVRVVRGAGAASVAGQRLARWDPESGALEPSALAGADAVVHLAGESVAGGRWTEAKKRRIRSSRVDVTRRLAEALPRLGDPPRGQRAGPGLSRRGLPRMGGRDRPRRARRDPRCAAQDRHGAEPPGRRPRRDAHAVPSGRGRARRPRRPVGQLDLDRRSRGRDPPRARHGVPRGAGERRRARARHQSRARAHARARPAPPRAPSAPRRRGASPLRPDGGRAPPGERARRARAAPGHRLHVPPREARGRVTPRARAAAPDAPYLTALRGSSASRKPSPTTLNARTASMIAAPGKSDTQGACARNSLPSFRIVPHEGVGGWTP